MPALIALFNWTQAAYTSGRCSSSSSAIGVTGRELVRSLIKYLIVGSGCDEVSRSPRGPDAGVLSAGGLACLVWMWWMRRSGIRTEGVVVDSGERWSSFLPATSFGCRSWRPVVQFTAAGGRMVEFRSKFGTPVRYEPGQLGALNEMVEFLAHHGTHVGGYWNMGWDLVCNFIGAVSHSAQPADYLRCWCPEGSETGRKWLPCNETLSRIPV